MASFFLFPDHLPLGGDGNLADATVDGGHRVLGRLVAGLGNLGQGEARGAEETVVADQGLLVLG